MRVRGEEERPIAALAAPQAPPRATPRTDEELVAAVRRGDDDAFGVLFERYRRRLIAFAAGMVGDHGRAEDVTQEVFISALRRLRATDAPIAFKPWIYEIARNACIDSFRRSRPDEVSLDVREGPAAAVVARLANATPGPVAALDDKERLADLRGAFGGLSESERDTLIMRELDGRSYREIGERLEMARSAVESTLLRARRKLEIEYEELRNGDRCRRVQGMVAAEAAHTGSRGPEIRDARRLRRHLSHCQPCRRAAVAAGVAAASAERRPTGSRVAGLLPLPAFLRPEGGALASLAGHAEPAVAWVKALAAAAMVTAAGLGAGVAVKEGAGVPLATGGAPALIERATGAGEGEPGRAAGADGGAGARGVGAPGVSGNRDPADAQGQRTKRPGRDRATSTDATGPGPRDAGARATTPVAGDGPGTGPAPTGLLSGRGAILLSRLDPGDVTRPGGLQDPTLDRLFPTPPTQGGGGSQVPDEPGKALGSAGGDAPEPAAEGRLPGGDATGGPQASANTAPPATVNSASDTPQTTATGASAPDAGMVSRAPAAP